MDKCVNERPRNIHYGKSEFELVVGIESRIEKPKYENIVTNWRMSGGMELPMGFVLDELSGEISGIPLVESDKRMYRIMGENRDGAGWVEIDIMVRRDVCRGEGLYREVEVGGVVNVECGGNELYIGYEKKRCVLGERDGKWEKNSLVCVRVSVIILLIVFGMLLTTMVLLMKRRKRNE